MPTTFCLELKLGYAINFVRISLRNLEISRTLTAHAGITFRDTAFLKQFPLDVNLSRGCCSKKVLDGVIPDGKKHVPGQYKVT